MPEWRAVCQVGIILLNLSVVLALHNGLGLTPQMGWNSWNHYGCNGYNYTTIQNTADAFFTQGLYQAGYRYVNLDDCWSAYLRDASGQLQPDQDKFPADQGQSLLDLIDYIHSKGLLFGLYSDAGRRTCARHDPGSLNHEEIDAQTWASWDVDYLKYDNCNSISEPLERYPPMRDALNATGRPIFYSLCEWGRESVPTWGRAVGNSWRTTGDISDNWNSMLRNLYGNNQWADFGGLGGWNDPDMLEVGNGGMTNTEYTSHFSLWSLMKAPLIIGCDVINMDSDTRTILTNTEVIAVNQDPRGIQGKLIRTASNTTEIWGGPLEGGDYAVVLFNKGDTSTSITVQWSDLNILTYVAALVRDLWAHSNLGLFTSSFSANVESHGVVMVRIIPTYSANYAAYSNSTL